MYFRNNSAILDWIILQISMTLSWYSEQNNIYIEVCIKISEIIAVSLQHEPGIRQQN